MLYDTAIIDYSPQQVLWAMTLHNGATSYNSDNKYYEEIRDWAFNSAGWKFTPKGDYVYNNLPQDKINKAPKRILMDAILNACECYYENNANDDRSFMELVCASMEGISTQYTITGKLIIN
jgi:hypothetical protein|tara:strand:+ start:247 stop:609 length:363 start_codon:yes stop_codon:yes gene_type:complete